MKIEKNYMSKFAILPVETFSQALKSLSTNGQSEIEFFYLTRDNFTLRELKKLASTIWSTIEGGSYDVDTVDDAIATIQSMFRAHDFGIPFDKAGPMMDGILVASTGKGNLCPRLYASDGTKHASIEKAKSIITNSRPHEKLAIVIDTDAKKSFESRVRDAGFANLDETLSIEEPLAKQSRAEEISSDWESIPNRDDLFGLLKNLETSFENLTNRIQTASGAASMSKLDHILPDFDTFNNLLSDVQEKFNSYKEEADSKYKAIQDQLENLKAQNVNLETESSLEINSLKENVRVLDAELKILRSKLLNAPDMDQFNLCNAKIEALNSDRDQLRREKDESEKKVIEYKQMVSKLEAQELAVKNEYADFRRRLDTVTKGTRPIAEKMEISQSSPIKAAPSFNLSQSMYMGCDDDDSETFHDAPQILTVGEGSKSTDSKETYHKTLIFKPSSFGLSQWNPNTQDISSYIDRVLKACSEAKEVGAKETQLIRLIMRTLPDQYEFVESFIEESKKNKHEEFAKEVVRILGAKTQRQMHNFITAQRKTGESLLSYFARIVMLYRSSNNLPDDWETKQCHTGAIYSKIYEACYDSQRTELMRLADQDLEKGTLEIKKLREILINVSKLADDKFRSEVASEINVVEGPKAEKSKPSQNQSKRVTCWFCKKRGHVKRECYAYKKVLLGEGKNRETADSPDGRKL